METGIHDGFNNNFAYGMQGKIETVKELIKALLDFPKDARILIERKTIAGIGYDDSFKIVYLTIEE